MVYYCDTALTWRSTVKVGSLDVGGIPMENRKKTGRHSTCLDSIEVHRVIDTSLDRGEMYTRWIQQVMLYMHFNKI